nr:MAG TPA: hypothetical protein [Caudoviricetes sp.]
MIYFEFIHIFHLLSNKNYIQGGMEYKHINNKIKKED